MTEEYERLVEDESAETARGTKPKAEADSESELQKKVKKYEMEIIRLRGEVEDLKMQARESRADAENKAEALAEALMATAKLLKYL